MDKAICSDTELAGLDSTLAKVYTVYRRQLSAYDQNSLRHMQNAWLKQRNYCDSNRTCLVRAYKQRISFYQKGKIVLEAAPVQLYAKKYSGPYLTSFAADLNNNGIKEKFVVDGSYVEEKGERYYVMTLSASEANKELVSFEFSRSQPGMDGLEDLTIWQVGRDGYILMLGIYVELMARSTYSDNDLYFMTSDFKVKNLRHFERSSTNGGTGGSQTHVALVYNDTGNYLKITVYSDYLTDEVDGDGEPIESNSQQTYYLKYDEQAQNVIEVPPPF